MSELAKGYTCTCGKEHTYPAYVYAHWNIALTHTCECGLRWTIMQGIPVIENVPKMSPRKLVRRK